MATIEYTPRGKGFEVHLEAGDLRLMVAGRGLDDGEPRLEGDEELLDNVALKTLVLGYAANELAYRRFRSAEKRKSHRRAADEQREDAVALADLVTRLESDTVTGWCSGCFQKAAHRTVRGAAPPRRTYLCQACGTPTVICAVMGCRHHAAMRPRQRVSLRYCAEHRHEIPGFEKLAARIEALADYEDLLKYEKRNAVRITKVTVMTLGAAAVIAPMALAAAPVMGAALGSSVLGGSLTGAAATSHGLAMLGFGSVASGGLGMAGGTIVVTATGTALGGALGATTAAAYVAADSSFKIELVKSGGGTLVVFATGFLTEGQGSWKDWRRIITARYPDSPVYQVHWGSKELKDLGALLATGGTKAAVRALLVQVGKRRQQKSVAAWPRVGSRSARYRHQPVDRGQDPRRHDRRGPRHPAFPL